MLRLAVGGATFGHAGRHLFGWAGGSGLRRSADRARARRFRAAAVTGPATGIVQAAGGLLTALGSLDPLGPLLIAFSMLVVLSIERKPFFVIRGGNEHAWLYLASGTALALTGPGAYALDAMLGVAVPAEVASAALVLGLVAWAALVITRRPA